MPVSIKWLGHASFQIKTGKKIIYVDLEKQSKPSEKADLVLVTHSHNDHCDSSIIEKIRKPTTVIIVPEDCVSKINGDIVTLKSGDEYGFDGSLIHAVEAYNHKRFRSPGNPYHPRGHGVGYLIHFEDKTIYHAGDTDLIPEMDSLGQVDVALLPSGGTYTMDNSEAAEAAMLIKPKTVIPMHRWDTDPREFKAVVESNSNIKVLILNEEEYFVV